MHYSGRPKRQSESTEDVATEAGVAAMLFENGRRSQEPRKAGGLEKLEKARK